MTVSDIRENNKLILKLGGQFDTSASIEFSKSLSMLLKGVDDVTFDFADLDYITSAVLRLLLTTQKTMADRGGKMQVTNLNESVLEIFKITHFIDLLNVK